MQSLQSPGGVLRAPVFSAIGPRSTTVKLCKLYNQRCYISSLKFKSDIGTQIAAGADRSSPTEQADAPPSAQPATSQGKKIFFAADGKPETEEGLRWVASQLARRGDTVCLAHVICDPRTPATAVGSSPAATQWSPVRDEQRFAKEYLQRLEDSAASMLKARFLPALDAAGINTEIKLLRLKVHMSAAGIGEALCSKAKAEGADMIVIVSHGPGVMADYGSVARWCTDHSPLPVMLIPLVAMKRAAAAGAAGAAGAAAPAGAVPPPAPMAPVPPSNSIVVAGAGNLSGLRKAFEYTVSKLARAGDSIYVLHAEQWAAGNPEEGGDPAMEARRKLLAAVAEWQQGSAAACAPMVNVACDVVTHLSSPEEGVEGNAGAQICMYAADFNARCVVLLYHGSSMVRELQYGPITSHCTKYCARPLLVYDAEAMPGVEATK